MEGFYTNLTGGPLRNTVYLERATAALQGHGQEVDATLLRYLSPLGWEHINLDSGLVAADANTVEATFEYKFFTLRAKMTF